MTLRLRHGLYAALLAGAPVIAATLATPVAAQAISKGVGVPLQKAQQLRSGSAAIAAVNAARSAAKTPAERAKVAQMAAYVYANSGQYALAAQQLEATGAGPRQLAPYYYRAGQYDKAIELARRAGGTDMQVVVAQSYLKKGDKKAAAVVYQQLIRTSGPKMEWLDNLASIQFSYDKSAYLNTVKQMIKIDPSPARYKALLFNLKQQNMSDQAKLVLYALMRQTGNLTEAADVQDMSKLAIIGGVPGMALGALQDAQKANVVSPTDSMITRLVQVSSAQSKAAVAGIVKQPATPAGRMAVGNAYFGSDQYPQAAQSYKQVVAANTPNADQARVLEGIALVRTGDANGARTVFDSVTRTGGFYDVAQLWSLYASTHKS